MMRRYSSYLVLREKNLNDFFNMDTLNQARILGDFFVTLRKQKSQRTKADRVCFEKSKKYSRIENLTKGCQI